MSHTFKVNTSTSSLNVLILEVLSNVTVAHGGKDSLTISLVIALSSLSGFQIENYTII